MYCLNALLENLFISSALLENLFCVLHFAYDCVVNRIRRNANTLKYGLSALTTKSLPGWFSCGKMQGYIGSHKPVKPSVDIRLPRICKQWQYLHDTGLCCNDPGSIVSVAAAQLMQR